MGIAAARRTPYIEGGAQTVLAARDSDLFETDPFQGFLRRAGLVRRGNLNLASRAVAAALLAWLPLLLLTLAEGYRMADFVGDVAVHARYLVAVPLFILAEGFCGRWLGGIARQFRDAGVVAPQDIPQYDAAVASTRERLESRRLAAVLAGLTALAVAAAWYWVPAAQWPVWSVSGERFTIAGWWHLIVSLPLFLVLLFGWFARLAMWARFLSLMARMDLRIVPTHPDRGGGIGFVSQSVGAFAGVALSVGASLAGRLAQDVLRTGTIGMVELVALVGVAVVMLLVFTAPLLVFAPKLARARRRGILEYGALASVAARAFENKWIRGEGKQAGDLLANPDFSALADLSQVVAAAHAMRTVPVDFFGLLLLAGGMLLPFVPVVLLTVPPDIVLAALKTLLP